MPDPPKGQWHHTLLGMIDTPPVLPNPLPAAINLVGSPGSGRTQIVKHWIKEIKHRYRPAQTWKTVSFDCSEYKEVDDLINHFMQVFFENAPDRVDDNIVNTATKEM